MNFAEEAHDSQQINEQIEAGAFPSWGEKQYLPEPGDQFITGLIVSVIQIVSVSSVSEYKYL